MNNRFVPLLKAGQVFFYLSTLLLWFKKDLPGVSDIPIPLTAALFPLLIITGCRMARFFSRGGKKISLRINSIGWVMIGILCLAVIVRCPLMRYPQGLIDADDGIPLLVAKHIAEGKTPPVYHYGQFYLGTFNYHLYALLFKILGFSILGPLGLSVCFYLAFIVSQFFVVKELGSSPWTAVALCFFYALPIGHLFGLSFHLGISFPLVMLLGSGLLGLGLRIGSNRELRYLPFLGFLIGFLYWMHPLSIVFSLTVLIWLEIKLEQRWKILPVLAVYAAIGAFPVLVYEITHGLPSLKQVFSRGTIPFPLLSKLRNTGVYIVDLVSTEASGPNLLYLFIFLTGLIMIIWTSLRKKILLPENILVLFVGIFTAAYLISGYSAPQMSRMRYLYPLYIVIPFLSAYPIRLLKTRRKPELMIFLFSLIFLVSNSNIYSVNLSRVKKADQNLRYIQHRIESTGRTHWAGDFWQINLLTALSGEKVMGWPYNHIDYNPYMLEYLNRDDNNNFVFFFEPGSFAIKFKERYTAIEQILSDRYRLCHDLIRLLDVLGVEAQVQKIGDCGCLIFSIPGFVSPKILNQPFPEKVPEPSLGQIRCDSGFLLLPFTAGDEVDSSRFRIHMEIPGYSHIIRGCPPTNSRSVFRLPFPPEPSFPVRYYLDYLGLEIPATQKEFIYSPSRADLDSPRNRQLFLNGFGPQINLDGKKAHLCGKNIAMEINRPLRPGTRLDISLNFPFDMSGPFWYGEHSQEITVNLNGVHIGSAGLNLGENSIVLKIPESLPPRRRNRIHIVFKYHLIDPDYPYWPTAAYLNKIRLLGRVDSP